MEEEDIEGTIESLAFGGQGIMKVDGLVVFVPFTVPGDRIRCKITHRKKNYAEASLIEILQEGPGRATPVCPYYRVCGGCQLQHMSYPAQLTYKQKSVFDALERIGKLTLPSLPDITPAEEIWEYRRHVTLNIVASDHGYQAGYVGTDQTSIIAVRQCPIFLSLEDSVFKELSQVLHDLESRPGNAGRVTLLKTDSGSFLFYFRFNVLPENFEKIIEEAHKRWPHWSGIAAIGLKKNFTIGSATTQVVIDNLQFTFSPAVFIQNNAEQSLNIYRDIVRLSQTKARSRILDLYCGIGISSLLLAREGHEVLGVEGNKSAIDWAKKNAAANHFTGVNFVASDVKKGLKTWLSEFKPDLVIVNPPRGGLDPEVVSLLERNLPDRLLYVSCMPPTLARDLSQLCKEGYRINACKLYDMFPQTSHIETLVELVGKSSH